jgi:hypothetical protein
MINPLRAKVLGINRFLSDVYDKDLRLSQLLLRLGFEESQVNEIKRQHVPAVVDTYLDGIQSLICVSRARVRDHEIMVRRYGLDGNSVRTLRSLGEAYGISHERVRQLQRRAVRRCRSTYGRRFLEDRLREAVQRILDGNPEPAES